MRARSNERHPAHYGFSPKGQNVSKSRVPARNNSFANKAVAIAGGLVLLFASVGYEMFRAPTDSERGAYAMNLEDKLTAIQLSCERNRKVDLENETEVLVSGASFGSVSCSGNDKLYRAVVAHIQTTPVMPDIVFVTHSPSQSFLPSSSSYSPLEGPFPNAVASMRALVRGGLRCIGIGTPAVKTNG